MGSTSVVKYKARKTPDMLKDTKFFLYILRDDISQKAFISRIKTKIADLKADKK